MGEFDCGSQPSDLLLNRRDPDVLAREIFNDLAAIVARRIFKGFAIRELLVEFYRARLQPSCPKDTGRRGAAQTQCGSERL